MTLTIRDYTDADWPAVCGVHDRARAIELGDNAGRPVRPLAEVAEEDGFHRSRTAVAVLASQIVGFASVDGPYLSFLYVDPPHHRRGIGRALLQQVTAWMGPEGYTHAGGDNAAAIALYRSVGMEIACRFPGESDGVPAECVRLAFPTSPQRHRPGRPTALALQLEAHRRGVPVEALPQEWPAEL